MECSSESKVNKKYEILNVEIEKFNDSLLYVNYDRFRDYDDDLKYIKKLLGQYSDLSDNDKELDYVDYEIILKTKDLIDNLLQSTYTYKHTFNEILVLKLLKLQKENADLGERLSKLEHEFLELKYQPGGHEYLVAKQHFEKIKDININIEKTEDK